ncbi:hypothetical protein [Bradyrhizobium sp. CSA112]|uniref:hypothetical protein n=1 Tax=Bradyrhizobium sp. CSA112 TaxID=2699170 RepID=UPI0023B1F380|nr:hypothetical protein [Bradyrhizobium sp. CSA112]
MTASGSHTFAIYILLSGQLQPHCQVLMGLGWDELKLTNPVRPGDALDLEMTVLELRAPRNRNLTGESSAIETCCAIKSARRCWNTFLPFSLRGKRRRTLNPHVEFRCWHETDQPGWSRYVRCWGKTRSSSSASNRRD